MKIELKGEWMEIQIGSTGAATITSSLKQTIRSVMETECMHWNDGVDAIESLVLGHFCAGVDVFGPAYREGIQTALDALSNNIYG